MIKPYTAVGLIPTVRGIRKRADIQLNLAHLSRLAKAASWLYHRARAQWDNWLKDLRTELYQLVYEQPIYPKNLYLERQPMKHAEYREQVIERQIHLLHDRSIWAKPER